LPTRAEASPGGLNVHVPEEGPKADQPVAGQNELVSFKVFTNEAALS